MQQQCADFDLFHQAGERCVSTFSKLNPVLADRGQRRRSVGTDRKVIETDDTDIVWNVISKLLALNDGGVGNLVMAADDGSDSKLQKSW